MLHARILPSIHVEAHAFMHAYKTYLCTHAYTCLHACTDLYACLHACLLACMQADLHGYDLATITLTCRNPQTQKYTGERDARLGGNGHSTNGSHGTRGEQWRFVGISPAAACPSLLTLCVNFDFSHDFVTEAAGGAEGGRKTRCERRWRGLQSQGKDRESGKTRRGAR